MPLVTAVENSNAPTSRPVRKQYKAVRLDFLPATPTSWPTWVTASRSVPPGPHALILRSRRSTNIVGVNPQSMVHLTEKPVELATRAMQYSSRPGEHVLDLFGGNGSTLIGAEQTGRKAFLIELDPLYCDVIVQRWEKFAGQKRSVCLTSLAVPFVAIEERVVLHQMKQVSCRHLLQIRMQVLAAKGGAGLGQCRLEQPQVANALGIKYGTLTGPGSKSVKRISMSPSLFQIQLRQDKTTR